MIQPESLYSDWISQMWTVAYPMCALLCSGGWVWYLISGIECVVDFFWILNHFLIGSLFLYKSYSMSESGLHWTYFLQYLLLLFWFIRLGGFLLFTRVLTGHEDKRYVAMRKRFPNSQKLYFCFNYQLQAVL